MIQIKKTILTLVALLAVTTGAWAQTGENVFQYCYDCSRDPAYPQTTASALLSGFANPLVGYNGTGFEIKNTPDGPWKLEYMGIWSTTNQYGIDDIWNYQDTYNCTDVPVFRLYQWNATANEYQHAAYGVVCAYAKVSNVVEHTALFVAEGGWGCVLTNSSHSSSMNITFDEDLTTGITALIAAATPDASGPEVAWNKASKTGTFTMPGGNVELEPEYYPQATMVAGAVTAVAGVKATTDDPLVTLDKTKLIGASGMMYYVGTTDTKPAYNAEGWTSEVPTAADITMAKTVYVWYYPVGADSDNPAKTYSDGEMNINALQVAVADPPTYAITLAEGTEDVGEWVISPAEATKGSTITATYSGDKKVKSVKAVKKGGAYLKWNDGQKKLVATDIPTTANKVQNSDENIEWAGTYVVEDDVTINGEIKLTGDVELIIKDGAKLTVTKIIHTQSGASLSVYGQTQMSGELNVTNQGSDAIFALYSLAVHSCKVKATSPAGDGGGVYNTTTLNVYGGSLDAEYTGEGSGHGIILKKGGALNIYGGEVKAVGKGNHADYSYGIKSSSSSEVANVKVYGGKLWAECAGNKAFRQINLTTEAGFTGKIETSSNGSSWTDWTTEGTPNTKYVKVE